MPIEKGRKLTNNPRSVRLEIRLTQSENDMLVETAKAKKTSKTRIITEGIKRVYDSLQK